MRFFKNAFKQSAFLVSPPLSISRYCCCGFNQFFSFNGLGITDGNVADIAQGNPAAIAAGHAVAHAAAHAKAKAKAKGQAKAKGNGKGGNGNAH